MEQQTITVLKSQWDRLHQQLDRLRKENLQLKQPQDLTLSYTPKSIEGIIKKKSKLQRKFSTPQAKDQLKKSLSTWSKNLQDNNYRCFQKQKIQDPPKMVVEVEDDDQNIEIQLNSDQEQFAILNEQPKLDDQLKINEDQNQLKLLECVCLYGPNKKEVQLSKTNKKTMARSQLHYTSSPSQYKKYEGYGAYFYPEGQIKTRKIRNQEVMTHINKIIFKKNTKRDQCYIYLFQKDQANQLLRERNQMLESINPGKWLTAFCIQFYDYFTFDDDFLNIDTYKVVQLKNKRLSHQQQLIHKIGDNDDGGENLTKSTKMTKRNSNCLVSKFTLCVFTYFPLVSLMEQILIKIVDQIKQRRIAAYAEQNQKIQDINYEFLVNQLSVICKKLKTQLSDIPPQIGSSGTLVIGTQETANPLTIQLTKENIINYFYSGWAYQVIKQFDKDRIYQIFCSILLEETVILLCENLHLLTYTIFLFAIGLLRPLYYPHPCISVIFNLQLLDTPFIVTAGINNNTQWLKQNVNLFSQKIIFIDLNKSEETSIFDKKKPHIKSQKLRKVFKNLYKQIDAPLFKKKQKIIKPTSKQQNENIYKFVKGIEEYFKQEILNHLPKKQIIQCMHKNVEDTNQSSKVSMLLKQIFKYLKQSRKEKDNSKDKDMFLNQYDKKDKDSILNIINKQNQNYTNFLSTQIFQVFLSDYYGLY